MTKFHVTFEVVTPESAEHGDAELRGYVHANGGEDELELVETADDYAMDLRTALNKMGGCEDTGTWFVETDGRHNYRTGAVTTYSLHPPRNITGASYRRLAQLLRA
jgi:hypothetical protein